MTDGKKKNLVIKITDVYHNDSSLGSKTSLPGGWGGINKQLFCLSPFMEPPPHKNTTVLQPSAQGLLIYKTEVKTPAFWEYRA